MTTAELISGAGNLIVLLDARESITPSGAEARAWCEAAVGRVGRPADGLLVLHTVDGAAGSVGLLHRVGSVGGRADRQ